MANVKNAKSAKNGTKNPAKNARAAEAKKETVVMATETPEKVEKVAEMTAKSNTFTEEEVNAMIAKAVEQATAKAAAEASAKAVQPIVFNNDVPRVRFLWQAPVANDNVLLIGEGRYAKIIGATGEFSVPHDELAMAIDPAFRHYLDTRWIIVVSGLTDEERENLGVNYKEGEILTKKAFSELSLKDDAITSIFPDLCDAHKEIVAKLMLERYLGKKGAVSRETVITLNNIYKSPAFVKIIEGLNKTQADEML